MTQLLGVIVTHLVRYDSVGVIIGCQPKSVL